MAEKRIFLKCFIFYLRVMMVLKGLHLVRPPCTLTLVFSNFTRRPITIVKNSRKQSIMINEVLKHTSGSHFKLRNRNFVALFITQNCEVCEFFYHCKLRWHCPKKVWKPYYSRKKWKPWKGSSKSTFEMIRSNTYVRISSFLRTYSCSIDKDWCANSPNKRKKNDIY